MDAYDSAAHESQDPNIDGSPSLSAVAEVVEKVVAGIGATDMNLELTIEALDLGERMMHIEQSLAMVDYHQNRQEILSLETKYEVKQLRSELREMRDLMQKPSPIGSASKGKEPCLPPTSVVGFLDMVAPDSPVDNDVVFVGARKPVQSSSPGTRASAVAPFSDNTWGSSTGSFFAGLSEAFKQPRTYVSNETQICGLFSSIDIPTVSAKVPKMEDIPFSKVFSSPLQTIAGVDLTPAMQTPTTKKRPNPNPGYRAPARAARRRSLSVLPKPDPSAVIPESHAMFLRPTPDMGLTKEECCMASYVLCASAKYSDTEIIFQHKPIALRRKYFSSLRPDFVPHGDVFIPVREPNGSWYILLLDVKGTRLHALDVNRSSVSIMRRDTDMRRIRPLNMPNFTDRNPDPNTWGGIEFPVGLPARLDPGESAVWTLSWLLHDGRFSTAIFGNMGFERNVRMKAAMVIATSEFNDVKTLLELKAESIWKGFPDHVLLN
ncbi:hypothetical protein PIB30_013524 [Stylosanthes scabra]|uniref:Uncharacterized protein n=1 Tax=Stylosanthes scabra TaxID=79078 RepID=A0ABU6R631_9FABA|nr:hypothetical protein [Stylosanthes scabra]